MVLSISEISKLPEGEKIHLSAAWETLEREGYVARFDGPVTFDGVVIPQGGGVYNVRGRIKSKLFTTCDRCLKPFSMELQNDISESFARQSTGEEDIYLYTGDKLELTQMVQDNILLNLPIKVICSDSCLGLCPICGVDLNKTHCSCRK